VRQSNLYTFLYITGIALVTALVLSAASQTLKPLQEKNVELDMKKNILIAVGLYKEKGCDVAACYKNSIKGIVVNHKGEVVASVEPESIDFEAEMEKAPEKRKLPVFLRRDNGKTTALCMPIVGKGLWSTLYGYIALGTDYNTVVGLTFYKHGETPGLGAEIESAWFLKNFQGKKIYDTRGNLVSVTVVKGTVSASSPMKDHEVDGISGATLTGNGVNLLLKKCLSSYAPYFRKMRKEN
jgi:Na+-transporting NADH:ubiquinone oxidoreductase subunit C